MKRTIIISIIMTLFFATTSEAASQSYLNRKINDLNKETYKFQDMLDPTLEALYQYCDLAKTNSFGPGFERLFREEEIDTKIEELKEKDGYIQDQTKELAQSLYDSGYTADADDMIDKANRQNDDRVNSIRDILKQYSECLDK